MTDPDPDTTAGATPSYQMPAAPQAATAQAGWYPDPWDRNQHRYWNGTAWTAHAFPNGPGAASQGPADTSEWAPRPEDTHPTSALSREDGYEPPPPRWAPPAYSPGFETSPPPSAPAAEAQPGGRPPRLLRGRAFALTLLVVALVVGVAAATVTYYATRSSGSNTPASASGPFGGAAPTTPGTAPAAPADRDAGVLPGLVVAQADVAPSVTVQPLPNGDSVTSEATLDLCNGNFPSESARTARLQVAAADARGNTQLSTEAVLYQSPAATTQAFAELRSVAASCPNRPVQSPVGEPTVTTKFNAAPDASWAQVPTVDRQAYDFVTTDTSGQSEHSVAVYLRRGRVLMGVYFPQPDGAQSAVHGQTTIAGIVNVFATRMAQLPSSVVNG